MTSAVAGGSWLRIGADTGGGGGRGAAAAVGFFLAPQPARHRIENRKRTEKSFFIAQVAGYRPI